MSDHASAPSFGGQSHFTQPWPHLPSMPSMNPHDLPFDQSYFPSWPHQPPNGAMLSLDYNTADNSRPNSRVPDFSTQPSSLPPRPFPFMGQLPPQQFPQLSFSPAQMSPMNYPPIPLPSFHAQQVDGPAHDTRMNVPTFGSQTTNTPNSRQDLDREEGEVTDREIGGSLSKSAPHAVYNRQNLPEMDVDKSRNANSSSQTATIAVPDLEEGEAVSSISSNSTRDSGSRMSLVSHQLSMCINIFQHIIRPYRFPPSRMTLAFLQNLTSTTSHNPSSTICPIKIRLH